MQCERCHDYIEDGDEVEYMDELLCEECWTDALEDEDE